MINKIAVSIGDTFNSPFSKSTAAGGKGIGELVSLAINTSFVVAGVLILFFLILAGFNLVKSAGNGNSQEAEKAKSAATMAAVGFVIIFSAYWIVRLIEIILGYSFITNI